MTSLIETTRGVRPCSCSADCLTRLAANRTASRHHPTCHQRAACVQLTLHILYPDDTPTLEHALTFAHIPSHRVGRTLAPLRCALRSKQVQYLMYFPLRLVIAVAV